MALTAPTPPTPPTIDKGDVQTSSPKIDAHQFFEIPEIPFKKNDEPAEKKVDAPEKPTATEKPAPVTRTETNPEDMARDAVANGAGTLTRRTVTRPEDARDSAGQRQQSTNDGKKIADEPTQGQSAIPDVVAPIPAQSSASRYERGQEALRSFEEEDKQFAAEPKENSALTSTPAMSHRAPYEESHGGIFWIVTLIFVVVATFFVAKKFLFRKNPTLRKSDLFTSSSEKLKSTAEKFSTSTTPADKKNSSTKPAKPVQPTKTSEPPPVNETPPQSARVTKKDDDVKHFEVRI